MWNLTADDVNRAKEELKGRRAAIQARYENELKQLEVDIADLETFERFAVKFVSDFKGEEEPAAATVEAPAAVGNDDAAIAEVTQEVPAMAADPEPAAAHEAEAQAETQVEAEAEVVPGAGAAVARKGSSRWRMHLSAGEASA